MSIQRRLAVRYIFLGLLLLASACAVRSQDASKPQENSLAKDAPTTPNPYVMDGGAGPCSVELTVLDDGGKPVFSALVHVHLTYGFGGFHKLDLSVYTNHDGKAKFIGLPAKLHNPPAVFQATKDQLTGEATYSPSAECSARHEIVLQKPKPDAAKP
jgi:hypothetical protein